MIVEVNNPADDRIAQYFDSKGYETEGNQLDAGKTAWFLKVITGIVLSVGVLISILSFYILMLSIYLLLQKNTTKLENLLLIGYSPARVARPYQLLTIILNLLVYGLGVMAVVLVRGSYMEVIGNLYPAADGSTLLVSLLAGALIFMAVSLLNIVVIRKKIDAIWLRK